MRVLIVEDDPVLMDGLRVGLGLCGAVPDSVENLADARAALAATQFDAIVLDIMLPDGRGLDLLGEMRKRGDDTPIILLTALDETSDRIRGLDQGADDYIGKPFDLDELAARLRAVQRRRQGRTAPQLQAGDIVLDPAAQAVTVNGVPATLSRREIVILAALMERSGIIRSRSELEDRLYGWQEEVESNAVEVHIHNLRAKIGRDAIQTVRGLGYRMRTTP